MFHGRVVAYDPPNVFSFTWGGELLRFELLPEGDGTVLVFTQVLSHQSVAARNGAGWHACLDALDRAARRGGRRRRRAPTGDDVYDDYVDRIGPAARPPRRRRGGDVGAGDPRRRRARPRRHRRPRRRWRPGARAERAGDPLRWDVEPTDHGTVYRLTHEAIGDDAELAATWHALLVQLDMYLAAGAARARRPEAVGRRLPRHPLSRRARPGRQRMV